MTACFCLEQIDERTSGRCFTSLYRIRSWAVTYEGLLLKTACGYIPGIVRKSTYSSSAQRMSALRIVSAAYSSIWKLLTLRAVQLGELNQGLSSIRTFVRPYKLNDSRRRLRLNIICRRLCCFRGLHRSRARFASSKEIKRKPLQRVGWHPSENRLEWFFAIGGLSTLAYGDWFYPGFATMLLFV